jgi:ABC-2 type transport system permease protein
VTSETESALVSEQAAAAPPASVPSAAPEPRTDGVRRSRWDAYRAMVLAHLRETYREPEVVFWGFVFPILLSVCLGIAFRNRPVEVVPVAVVKGPTADRIAASLRGSTQLKVTVKDEAEAALDLRQGRIDLVIQPTADGAMEYRLDPTRPESAVARARVDDVLQRAAGRRDTLAARDVPVTEPGGRYIDFLIPGILGMNIMSGGMWGIGFGFVDMRIKRLLKRLVATPMHRGDFLAARLTVRLLFMGLEMGVLLAFGRYAFGMPLRGPLVAALFVGAVGAIAFGGMGLFVACRATRIETVTGLMNVVMMPMFVCSGIFFSADRFPDALQPVIRALPLTALNDALRAVILEGAPLATQAARLAILAAWGGFSFVAGLRYFRWN